MYCDTPRPNQRGSVWAKANTLLMAVYAHTDSDELVDASDDAFTLLIPAPLPPLPQQRLVHQLTHLICCHRDPTSFCLWLLGCTVKTHMFNMRWNPIKTPRQTDPSTVSMCGYYSNKILKSLNYHHQKWAPHPTDSVSLFLRYPIWWKHKNKCWSL